ncbi:MAG: TCP-1/cpn60 chaperonin family protein, partial [Chloroflexota bacterium]
HRVEDALSATRAAVEEGIVPGGGIALVNAMKALDGLKLDLPDETTGVAIVRKALERPLKGIVENAGLDGAVVLAEIVRRQKESGNVSVAYDVIKNEYVDMFLAGIIDPCKVTRSAVENAASIAAMILSTEALITDIPEPPAPAPAGSPDY